MSQEPKVTRFGADPTVDQELATKAYVDAGGGGVNNVYFNQQDTDTPPIGAIEFWSIGGNENPNSAESQKRSAVVVDFTWSTLTAFADSNAANGDTIIRTRIGPPAADGNQSVTIPASTAGVFQDLVNTDAVTATQTINYELDNSAAGAGNIFMKSIASLGLIS